MNLLHWIELVMWIMLTNEIIDIMFREGILNRQSRAERQNRTKWLPAMAAHHCYSTISISICQSWHMRPCIVFLGVHYSEVKQVIDSGCCCSSVAKGWTECAKSRGPVCTGREFQAKFLNNFPFTVKIRTSGYQTLQCFYCMYTVEEVGAWISQIM